MRRMSFALTERQLLAGRKTVTRRMGWWTLKPGEELMAVQKCMGLKKGQKQKPLAVLRVTAVTPSPVSAVDDREATLEGFPHMTGPEFVRWFCKAQSCEPTTIVNRIEFEMVQRLAPLEK